MPAQNVFGVYTEYAQLERSPTRTHPRRRPWVAVTVLLALALMRR